MKKNIFQYMAEKQLGVGEAKEAHRGLAKNEVVFLTILKRKTRVWWGKVRPCGLARDVIGWNHVWTDDMRLWHVELRDPQNWKHIPTESDFLWMAIALLTIENPLMLPGVESHRCISLWSALRVGQGESIESWL